MNSPHTMGLTDFEQRYSTQANPQTAQAVVDAYGCPTPTVRSLILSRLMGQAFEALPAAQRFERVTHLLKPLGMLARATVANGVFLNNQCGGQTPDMAVTAAQMQRIQASAVVDLADRVQQVSVEGLTRLHNPSRTGHKWPTPRSRPSLKKIPLRRTRARQTDDAFL